MVTGTAALKAAATGSATDIVRAANAAGRDVKPKDLVKHMLEQNKHVIAQALPRHMNPERLMRVAITSVTSNPALLECYVPTLIGGIIQCSQMGLEPNTVLGHAYLIPFKNTKKNRKDAQVVIGYKGLIDLARRSGQIVSIAAHAVRQHDTFEYEYGLEEKLKHIPADSDRGEITHFYAVAHMKDGGHAFEVMTRAAVMTIRNSGQGKNNPVWSDHFEEMGRKTVIRRLAKYLPLSVELATAVAMEDTTARGESQNLDGVLDGDFSVKSDDEAAGAPVLTAGSEGGAPVQSSGNPADDPRTLLEQVKDACTAAAAISDKNVAYLKLDDARFLLQEMADDNRALAVKEIDAAQATIDARE
jgi:recombination protein RecT